MEELQSIINQIAIQVDKHGGKMYYVGGYVRDLYLGKEPSDIDVRVIGISKEEFSEILEEFGKICWIDARYDIVKLIGFDIDFASPENKDGSIKTIEDLTQGVDFTMNSIFMDVLTGEVIDPFKGIEDIKNRVIRIAKLDEVDDEFLAIRACRFKAKLGFSIDEESAERIKGFSFENVKTQRILPELRKVLNNPLIVQSEFYRVALELGILGKLFEPLQKIHGLEVEARGVKLDAFEHTMRMLDYLMQFKSRIEDFEEYYMICLTYHLREVGKHRVGDDFREFFNNIIATNKMRHTVNFFQDNEQKLFLAYNSFQGMSDEGFAEIYRKYRRKLEFSGYVIESFRMAAKGSYTKEDLQKSKDRVDAWEKKILDARESSITHLKAPKHKRTKKMRKISPTEQGKFTLEDVKKVTGDITPEEVRGHFSRSIAKRRGRNGRYR